MSKKGYIILELGWEYNDEYYQTGNNGDTYEAPTEVFLDKTKAEEEMLKREIKSYRHNFLGGYFGYDGVKDFLAKGVTIESLTKYIKDNFNVELDIEDYFDLNVPEKATDEQMIGLINLLTLRFFELQEVTIN